MDPTSPPHDFVLIGSGDDQTRKMRQFGGGGCIGVLILILGYLLQGVALSGPWSSGSRVIGSADQNGYISCQIPLDFTVKTNSGKYHSPTLIFTSCPRGGMGRLFPSSGWTIPLVDSCVYLKNESTLVWHDIYGNVRNLHRLPSDATQFRSGDGQWTAQVAAKEVMISNLDGSTRHDYIEGRMRKLMRGKEVELDWGRGMEANKITVQGAGGRVTFEVEASETRRGISILKNDQRVARIDAAGVGFGPMIPWTLDVLTGNTPSHSITGILSDADQTIHLSRLTNEGELDPNGDSQLKYDPQTGWIVGDAVSTYTVIPSGKVTLISRVFNDGRGESYRYDADSFASLHTTSQGKKIEKFLIGSPGPNYGKIRKLLVTENSGFRSQDEKFYYDMLGTKIEKP